MSKLKYAIPVAVCMLIDMAMVYLLMLDGLYLWLVSFSLGGAAASISILWQLNDGFSKK